MSKCRFDPRTDGFSFVNYWELDETTQQHLFDTFDAYLDPRALEQGGAERLPIGKVSFAQVMRLMLKRFRRQAKAFGQMTYGMDGGMVYAALDFYHAGLPVRGRDPWSGPPTSGTRLHSYIVKRQLRSFLDSLDRFLVWLIYLNYLPKWLGGGPAWLAKQSKLEWEKLQAFLDAGTATPLGLVRNTTNLFECHLVLAVGYQNLDENHAMIQVYDPNCPRTESAIHVEFGDEMLVAEESCNAVQKTAGFFCLDYVFSDPAEISEAFVTLRDTSTAREARQLLERLRPTHVIVRRTEPEDSYQLYPTPEALNLLARADDWASVCDAFSLNESEPTPTTEMRVGVESAPDRSVVIEEDRVVGVVDERISDRVTGGEEKKRVGPANRSLEVELFPQQLTIGETGLMLVSLSAARGLPVPSMAIPNGARVDVVVQLKRGFAIEEKNEDTLFVIDENETPPAHFRLKATELGPGRIKVLALYQGQLLSATTLTPTVLSLPERPPAQVVAHPDLTLVITEESDKLSFELTAPDPSLELNRKPFGSVPLCKKPRLVFQEFFRNIEDLSLDTADERAMAKMWLDARGANLFQTLLPEALRNKLWELRTRIQTVQVQSAEPWIPWELCKLSADDSQEPEPFLCEAFAVTRWIPGISFKMTFPLKRVAVVVPGDSGLRLASDERKYMLSLASDERQVKLVPATYMDVVTALGAEAYDGWHFTGHGSSRSDNPEHSRIELEHTGQTQKGQRTWDLTPADLGGQPTRKLRQTRPFVFLNACQTGHSAIGLTGIDGWAVRFLKAEAAAFVGTYWSVYDQPAYDFAQALYGRLLSGMPIGQATREARAAIQPPDDLTWLAYTVYAHPLAAIEL
jgi:hypothetical protein